MKFDEALDALPEASVVGGQLIVRHNGKHVVVGTYRDGFLVPTSDDPDVVDILAALTPGPLPVAEIVAEVEADEAPKRRGRPKKAVEDVVEDAGQQLSFSLEDALKTDETFG